MTTYKRLAAALGATALVFAMFGTALAATGPSDQGVTPTLHDAANVTLDGNGNSDSAGCTNSGTADDPIWEGIETGDSAGSDVSPGGVTVTWTYDGTTKEFGFSATGGLVTAAFVKGSNGYNAYDYSGFAGGGVASDGGMFAPDNGSDGPAGLSHAVFCTGPAGSEATPTPTIPAPTPTFSGGEGGLTDAPTGPATDSLGSSKTSSPADGAWLLVVALGVLLASVVVLTPARAKSRR
jgi:hypothetical protein